MKLQFSHRALLLACQFLLVTILLSKSASVTGAALSQNKCDYTKGRWVLAASIPGYKQPYPAACPTQQRCRNLLPGQRHPTAYTWLPDPPCTYQPWPTHVEKLLTKYRDSTIALIGDSFSKTVAESFRCILAQASPYEVLRITMGRIKYEGLRFTRYNVTLISAKSGYLVNNAGMGNESYPSPQWTKVLPLTKAAVFTAGHWFFHDQDPPPLLRLRSAFSLTRDHLVSSHYPGRALALSFSPIHTQRKCSKAKAPLPAWSSPAALASATGKNTIPALRAQREVLMGSQVRLVDVTTMSRFRPDAHSRGDKKVDCSHWCLPGVPDSWNHVLISHLLGLQD